MRERLKRLRKGDANSDVRREIDALERLEQLTVTALNSSSAKYDALLRHAKDIGVGPKSEERLVVFSERVATLHWLRQKLAKDLKLSDKQIRVMHGGLTDQEQQELVDSFKQSASPIRVLITGDVASEGVNLHSQCHELVHFDIPWSLIRIEQRNGRIDRYGQRHAPRITTLLLDVDDDEFSETSACSRSSSNARPRHTPRSATSRHSWVSTARPPRSPPSATCSSASAASTTRSPPSSQRSRKATTSPG